jgi:L-alanine-DL-glutamate epimerase-like enolase superfamily enzyme
LELIFAYQEWPYRETFKISRGASVNSALFVAWLKDGDRVGRGECGILTQYGQTQDDLMAAFEAAREGLRQGPARRDLRRFVANSSVRNALDCALWDLECQKAGRDIWDLTGVTRAPSIEVDITISVNATQKMCADAARAVDEGYRLLKLKADRSEVLERVAAISERFPGVGLIIDANEAWDMATLLRVGDQLARLGVVLIEQPLPHTADDALAGYKGPVPICADESCRDLEDLERLAGIYQAINIKLDKVGGLTPALDLARAAKARGLKLMLGCSGPTSLGAAPAYVVATLADYVDLDGPALLLEDRAQAMVYREGRLHCFDARLWGG